MDRRRNPFVPGAGLQPPELAGRDRLLADASIDMDRVLDGRPAKGLILLGVRWVGKTVLLNRFRALADEKGFRTVRIEAPEGSSLPELLTPEVVAHLDKNFFRVRFDRLTPLEQKYLRAMAELGPGPCATGRIAETLGVRTASIATVRQRLVNKGMVWSQRHGETAFTVPMFDAFMKRQMPELVRHVPQRRAGR